MALSTCDATVTLADGTALTVADLLGDGTDASRDHRLPVGRSDHVDRPAGALARRTGHVLPHHRPVRGRVTLLECGVGAPVATANTLPSAESASVVSPQFPLRMDAAESILTGAPLSDEVIDQAATGCTEGASPLPETGHKVDLVKATVRETLERLRPST